MSRFLKDQSRNIGKSPGSIIHIGEKFLDQVKIEVMAYSLEQLKEASGNGMEALNEVPVLNEGVVWINIIGLHDTELLQEVGNRYNIHPLAMECIANTGIRPRLEDYGEYLMICQKMLRYAEKDLTIHAEQVSFLVFKNLLITWQEAPGDVFEPVRDRIRNNRGRIRKLSTDYLCFSLLDLMYDHYTTVLEQFGENIEELEEEVLGDPDEELLEKISGYKMELNYLRKSIRPARELAGTLSKLDSVIIHDKTRQFLKELLPNVTQAVEVADTYSNVLSDFLQVYHTSASNKMNEIMKVLTIFSAIFIPLTFLAGIYGMNFENLPEKNWYYGYYVFWGVVVLVGFLMFWFFRRRKWL